MTVKENAGRRLLAALLAVVCLSGCGVQSEPEDVPAMPTLTTPPGGTGSGDENSSEPSPYLRLYCPADLSDKNKSAGGGDAIVGLPIPWEEINAGDRGRQQQAQYIMELLLGKCTAKDFLSPVPVGTQLLSCTVTGGTVSVDLSGEYNQLMGIDRTIADYCITLSLMQLTGILAVRLTVAGELPADRVSDVYTSEEVLLTSPDDIVRTAKVTLYFPSTTGQLMGEERRLTVYEGESIAQAVVKALTEPPLDRYTDLREPLLPEGSRVLPMAEAATLQENSNGLFITFGFALAIIFLFPLAWAAVASVSPQAGTAQTDGEPTGIDPVALALLGR